MLGAWPIWRSRFTRVTHLPSPPRGRGWRKAPGEGAQPRPFPFAHPLAKVPLLGQEERVSRQLITEYRSELDRIHSASGSKRESVVREAFKDLLKRWGKSRDLIFLAEHEYLTPTGDRRYIDGALVHSIRVPFGYWEAKDTSDDLDEEIRKKTAIGYPRSNIIYDDTDTAVLIQNKREVARAKMDDTEALFHLLELFFAFERPEIADFRKAVRQFSADLPAVLQRLREIIAEKRAASRDFARAELKFLDHAREAINPAVTEEDVQEMLIQHILTEDIFAKVFDNPEFHRKNNVAAALYELEEKLFGYGEKSKLLAALRPYYVGIESTASVIESHSEKQGFLKGLYENFYKVYNPFAADRLGVVYTPGEIVRFMIRAADWLCEKHFDKNLIDSGVEILDPATGTGTYIVELLEHFRGNREKLSHKYKEELHANEVAILPYYVANLNIEATWHAITGQFAEFPGLVFVDTLDNVASLAGSKATHFGDLLGSISSENIERISRQNSRRISVIIGNPPYNANQRNENDDNKNRTYKYIDEQVKSAFVKGSKAKKTKRYDMYSRFVRWATLRLADNGIIAFITNRNFIDSKEADAFRHSIAETFDRILILDLGGDWKEKGRGGGANVFGIGTGVAISFFIKDGSETTQIEYARIPETGDAESKLSWLGDTAVSGINFELVKPDADGNWVDQIEHLGEDNLPLGSDVTKNSKIEGQERAIFKLFSLGASTNRDAWLHDRDRRQLSKKVRALISGYNAQSLEQPYSKQIKWSRNLKRRHSQGKQETFSAKRIIKSEYRPFSTRLLYASQLFVDELGAQAQAFRSDRKNVAICVSGGKRAPFAVLAINREPNLDFFLPAGVQFFPRYRYNSSGERIDNITEWALCQFEVHYDDQTKISKGRIFAYCYAILHDATYREKYVLNLKRDFPRIPLYSDFDMWAAWGEELLSLHVSYENAKPFKFARIDTPNPKRAEGSHPKSKLRSDPDKGLVVVDEDTQLTGIPREAWDYRLGNRSAIDWVLDQHKEKTPRDPTVRAKFNTYRFADYKEEMIKLLARVITVSLETVKITDAMRNLERESDA
jgi:predicted helicase